MVTYLNTKIKILIHIYAFNNIAHFWCGCVVVILQVTRNSLEILNWFGV